MGVTHISLIDSKLLTWSKSAVALIKLSFSILETDKDSSDQQLLDRAKLYIEPSYA